MFYFLALVFSLSAFSAKNVQNYKGLLAKFTTIFIGALLIKFWVPDYFLHSHHFFLFNLEVWRLSYNIELVVCYLADHCTSTG